MSDENDDIFGILKTFVEINVVGGKLNKITVTRGQALNILMQFNILKNEVQSLRNRCNNLQSELGWTQSSLNEARESEQRLRNASW